MENEGLPLEQKGPNGLSNGPLIGITVVSAVNEMGR